MCIRDSVDRLAVNILQDAHVTNNATSLAIDATLRVPNLGCPKIEEADDDSASDDSGDLGHVEQKNEINDTFSPVQHILLESNMDHDNEERSILNSALLSLSPGDVDVANPDSSLTFFRHGCTNWTQ